VFFGGGGGVCVGVGGGVGVGLGGGLMSVCTVTFCGGGVASSLKCGITLSPHAPIAKWMTPEMMMNAMDKNVSAYASRFVNSGGSGRLPPGPPVLGVLGVVLT